jgi:CHAT domain-containing protein
VDAPSIKGSAGLVAAAVALFPGRATVLRHQQATRKQVLDDTAGHAVIHLSCHGNAVAENPLNSRLVMALDNPITLRDLLARRLNGTRLVVLAACETAFPGAELPDEVVSLPTGLLQAGAGAAIGSLWSVDDLATMVLLTHFYELLGKGEVSLAKALRDAQQWVRDLTFDARTAAFPNVDFSGSGEPGPNPYAHPFWWAAFELTGA